MATPMALNLVYSPEGTCGQDHFVPRMGYFDGALGDSHPFLLSYRSPRTARRAAMTWPGQS